MKLGSSKGAKTGKWFANEILHVDDINFVGEGTYQNITDLLAILAEQGVASGTTKNIVISGLLLEWNNLLTSDFRAGMAVSYSGYYLASDGTWGFVASAGDIFSALVGADQAVAVDGGGAQDRYDTLEIRPIQTAYESKSRAFKDPVTGLVTSSNVETRIEYGYEFQILKGTEGGSPVAPTHTAGWIKIAEIHVIASATAITQNDIRDVRDSDLWTTEADNTKYIELYVGEKVTSSPTGGTATSLGKEATIKVALDEVFTRLRNLSGAQNNSVVNRHIGSAAVRAAEVDLGVDVGDVDADVVPLGTAVTSSPTGGTATNLANSSFVRAAIQAAFNRLRDLSGVENGAVDARHFNALVVTAWALTLLDDADAPTARATLDVYSKSEIEALNARTVTIEDAVAENDIIVNKWNLNKFYKSGAFAYAISTKKSICDNVRASGNQRSCMLTENLLINLFQDTSGSDVWAAAVSIDADGDTTVGADVELFNTADSVAYFHLCRVNDTCFMACWYNSTQSRQEAVIATVSGTTITGGSVFTLIAAQPLSNALLLNKKDLYVVLAYRRNSDNLGRGSVWLVNTGTRTAAQQGAEFGWQTSAISSWGGCSITEDVIALFFTETADVTRVYKKHYSISDAGTWTSEQSEERWEPHTNQNVEVMHVRSWANEWLFVIVQDTTANRKNWVQVYHYSTQDIRLVWSRYIQDQSTYWYYTERNAVSCPGGKSFIIGYCDSLKDNGGVLMFGPAGKGGAANSEPVLYLHHTLLTLITGTAQFCSEDIPDYKAIIVYFQTGDTYYSVQTFKFSPPRVVGFATQAKGASQPQPVQYSGVKGNFSGLTIGAEYYLTDTGALATKGIVKVGQAISTTELLVNIEDPW